MAHELLYVKAVDSCRTQSSRKCVPQSMPGEAANPRQSIGYPSAVASLLEAPFDCAGADTIPRHSKDRLSFPRFSNHRLQRLTYFLVHWYYPRLLVLALRNEQTARRYGYVAPVDPRENEHLP